jgi:hypothetical protein
MESTFVVRQEELTSEFLDIIKALFRNREELQITVSATEDFGLNKPESRQEYFARLEKAANNLENRVEMTEDELDTFVHNK